MNKFIKIVSVVLFCCV